MARRARAVKREIIPDAKYRSATVSRLIIKIMERGKKRTAEKIVYGALEKLGQTGLQRPGNRAGTGREKRHAAPPG